MVDVAAGLKPTRVWPIIMYLGCVSTLTSCHLELCHDAKGKDELSALLGVAKTDRELCHIAEWTEGEGELSALLGWRKLTVNSAAYC
jgi:hypothetical protein